MGKGLERVINFGKKNLVGGLLAVSSLFSGCSIETVPFESKYHKTGIDHQIFVGIGGKGVDYAQKLSSDELTFGGEKMLPYLGGGEFKSENPVGTIHAVNVKAGNSFVSRDIPLTLDFEGDFTFFNNKKIDFMSDISRNELNFGDISFYVGKLPLYTFEPSLNLQFEIPFSNLNDASPTGIGGFSYGLIPHVGVGSPITRFEWRKSLTDNTSENTIFFANDKYFDVGKSINFGLYLKGTSFKGKKRNEQSIKIGIHHYKEFYSNIKMNYTLLNAKFNF